MTINNIPHVQYGRYSACGEYYEIEEKIEELGICEEALDSNNKDIPATDKPSYQIRKEKLVSELKSDLSRYDIDLDWMKRFLTERAYFYNTLKEKEANKGQASYSTIGQSKATALAKELVKELLNAKEMGE